MTTHLSPAPVTFVHTKVTLYRSNLVDLRVSRTVHSCDQCSANQGMSLTGNTCGAVHYGRCTPVTLVSTVNTPARSVQVSTPPSTPVSPYTTNPGHRATPPNTPNSPSPTTTPRTMVNVVHIETQPRNTQTVTLGDVNSPITVGIPPRGYSPITIETSPRKSPSPSRTITFETQPSGKLSPRQVTIETFPAAALSPRNVAMEIYPRRGSPVRSLSPRSFVIETYPPNATMPKTFTIETRPIDAFATQKNVTMTTRTIPIEIRPSAHNKSLMTSSTSPGTTPRYLATNTITIPVTKSRVTRVPGIPTGPMPHHGGMTPRRPASLDGLVSMVNGHGGGGGDTEAGGSGGSGSSGYGSAGSTPGSGSGGAGIGSRAIPAPVTSIPRLSSGAAPTPGTTRAPPVTSPSTTHNIVRTHHNIQRVPHYIRIAAADIMRAQEAAAVGTAGAGEAAGSPGRDGRTPAAGQARSPGEDEPSSPTSPTLHVLRQVNIRTVLGMVLWA